MEKTLSSQTLRMAVKALEKLGLDMAPVLLEAQISAAKLVNPIARIPVLKERLFWKSVSEKSDEACIALRMAEQVPFGSFSLLEYIGASCQSVHQALVLFCRYAKIVHGSWAAELRDQKNFFELDLGFEGDAEEGRLTNEFGLALLYLRLNEFSGEKIQLQKVHFRHSAKGLAREYEKFFSCPVLFEQTDDGLFFDRSIQRMPCKNSDRFLLGSMLSLAEKFFQQLPNPSREAGAVTLQIMALVQDQLHAGEPEIKSIAKQLGLSARTLQRKLETENTSLSDILVRIRKAKAAELLASPDLSNEDIALMLGYSTLSAFNRAFRQWFQMTPSEFRKTLR